jgi:hypothetical protein
MHAISIVPGKPFHAAVGGALAGEEAMKFVLCKAFFMTG